MKDLGLNISSPEKFTISIPPILSLDNGKIKVGLAPFAKQKSKMYDLKKWKKILENLSKYTEIQFYIFGFGTKEQKIAKDIFLEMQNVSIEIGKMNKNEELALISSLDLMISMDSANAHLAAALGVSTIVIYGPTHPYLGFLPIGLSFSDTITPNLKKYPELPVSVYGAKIAKKWERIIDTISEEEIIDCILEKLPLTTN
jgi:ADP-heptose:LPS heptosyltransferase